MKFRTLHCFKEIVLIQAAKDETRKRMDDTKVLVFNTKTDKEHLCGKLTTRDGVTIQDQTYKIPCSMECGDEVKLTVRKETEHACIHLKEIKVFGFLAPGLL